MTERGERRGLTAGEVAIARSVYREAIDYSSVTVCRQKWWPFQPRDYVMAPTGHLHIHPESSMWSEDFSGEEMGMRALFVHELCHVWQTQRGVCLPLARHPFCRYHYSFRPGWPLERYGLEQQAEIARHAYLLREGHRVAGAPPLSAYESILAALR
jgi:hypothetical protein